MLNESTDLSESFIAHSENSSNMRQSSNVNLQLTAIINNPAFITFVVYALILFFICVGALTLYIFKVKWTLLLGLGQQRKHRLHASNLCKSEGYIIT